MNPIDPHDGVPPHARERVRLAITKTKLASARSLGVAASDEEIVKGEGYAGEDEFWRAALSKPIKASSYLLFLRQFHLKPREQDLQLLELTIASQLKLAISARLPWVFRDAQAGEPTPGMLWEWMVEPRAATFWLLSMPTERDLVPTGLREFLEPKDSVSSETGPATPPASKMPQPKLEKWLRAKNGNADWKRGTPAPTEGEDGAAFKNEFGKPPPREALRAARKAFYGDDYPERGRRRKTTQKIAEINSPK